MDKRTRCSKCALKNATRMVAHHDDRGRLVSVTRLCDDHELNSNMKLTITRLPQAA